MSTLDIRPLEPWNGRAVHALLSEPEVARSLGRTPFDSPEKYELEFRASFEGTGIERLGAFERERLVGVFELSRGTRARMSHAGQCMLAVAASEQRRGVGTALLRAALEACDRWLHIVRLDGEMLASDEGARQLFVRHGFEIEVRRRSSIVVDGQLADTVSLARIRPGFVQADGALAPLPAWPERKRAVPQSLVVRVVTPEDAVALSQFSRDPSVLFGSTQLPTNSSDAWRKRISGWASSGAFTLLAEVNGAVVACSNLHSFDTPRRRHCVLLGVSVLSAFQGLGVGDRLMTELLLQAEERLGAERIELQVFADNLRAVRLYEKHGFQREGLMRYDVWRSGGYADSVVMARLHPRRTSSS